MKINQLFLLALLPVLQFNTANPMLNTDEEDTSPMFPDSFYQDDVTKYSNYSDDDEYKPQIKKLKEELISFFGEPESTDFFLFLYNNVKDSNDCVGLVPQSKIFMHAIKTAFFATYQGGVFIIDQVDDLISAAKLSLFDIQNITAVIQLLKASPTRPPSPLSPCSPQNEYCGQEDNIITCEQLHQLPPPLKLYQKGWDKNAKKFVSFLADILKNSTAELEKELSTQLEKVSIITSGMERFFKKAESETFFNFIKSNPDLLKQAIPDKSFSHQALTSVYFLQEVNQKDFIQKLKKALTNNYYLIDISFDFCPRYKKLGAFIKNYNGGNQSLTAMPKATYKSVMNYFHTILTYK